MITWPSGLFPATDVELSLQGRTTTGGMSVSGISQLVKTDHGGLWRFVFSGIYLRNKDQVRTWRALEGQLDGGATKLVVPICDLRHAPRPGGALPGPSVPHSDDTYFSDDTGYVSGVMSAVTVGAATLGASSISVNMLVGSDLMGGEHFTIDHPTEGPRLYRVITVDGDSVGIRPTLREAVASGEVVDFDNPRCTMRLAGAEAMNLNLQLGRFGQVGVAFIEAF